MLEPDPGELPTYLSWVLWEQASAKPIVICKKGDNRYSDVADQQLSTSRMAAARADLPPCYAAKLSEIVSELTTNSHETTDVLNRAIARLHNIYRAEYGAIDNTRF